MLRNSVIAGSKGGDHLLKWINKRIPEPPGGHPRHHFRTAVMKYHSTALVAQAHDYIYLIPSIAYARATVFLFGNATEFGFLYKMLNMGISLKSIAPSHGPVSIGTQRSRR